MHKYNLAKEKGVQYIHNLDKTIKNYAVIFDIDDTILNPNSNTLIKPIYDDSIVLFLFIIFINMH